MRTLRLKIADLLALTGQPPVDRTPDVTALTPLILKQYGFLPQPLMITAEVFSGLQLMCLMHAGFKRLAPDTGMDLDAPFLKALELFQQREGRN